MPSANEHEEQAASNEEFYRELGGDSAARSDWAMNALFYAAVQHVQALIVRKGWKANYKGRWITPVTHEQRFQVVGRKCPQIGADLRALKNWSEGARYRCERFEGKLALARESLERIKREIQAIS